MTKAPKTYKIQDVIEGKIEVSGGHANVGKSKNLRDAAAVWLKEAGCCMLLSEFVKGHFGRFTRDEYNYARQVFMVRGGSFNLKKATVNGGGRERVFLVRVK